MHTYRQIGFPATRWTVGFFDSTIGWQALHDCTSEAQAINLVSHLNGGTGRVPLDPLFIASIPHPGDRLTLHLTKGETGLLHVDVAECLGMPIIMLQGEALYVTNDGLQIILSRGGK